MKIEISVRRYHPRGTLDWHVQGEIPGGAKFRIIRNAINWYCLCIYTKGGSGTDYYSRVFEIKDNAKPKEVEIMVRRRIGYFLRFAAMG